MLQALLSTIHYWLTIATSFLACELLLGAARWIALHMHEIASYRSPWLTVAENWFVRLFWLSLLAACLTVIIYTPDQLTRIVLIGILIGVMLMVILYWGMYYWYHDRNIKGWYKAYERRNPKSTEFIAFSMLVLSVSLLAWAPLLMVPLCPLVGYGAWQYHLQRNTERRDALLAEALAFMISLLLWNNHRIRSYAHEHVKVSPRTVRIQLELEDEATIARIEYWLLDDIRQGMMADRIVLRAVTDKSSYENPESRTIVDVWVHYPPKT